MDQNIPTPQVGVEQPNISIGTSPTPTAVQPIQTPIDQPPMPTNEQMNPPELPKTPDMPKKTSPVLIIALVLMLISAFSLGGYYLYTTFFSNNNDNVATYSVAPTYKTPSPTITPAATVSAIPTSSPSATPLVSASPSATPEE
jgi:hypothetical protein